MGDFTRNFWGWGGAVVVVALMMLPTLITKRKLASMGPADSKTLAAALSFPIAKFVEQKKLTDSSPEKTCIDSWRNLASWDLNPLAPRSFLSAQAKEDLRMGEVHWTFEFQDSATMMEKVRGFLAAAPCKLPDDSGWDALKNQKDYFESTCHEALSEKATSRNRFRCMGNLVWYRAYAISALMKGIVLEEIDDRAILANMLFAAGLASTADQAGRAAQIAERLLEIDPELDEAAVASLQFRYAHLRADTEFAKGRRHRIWAFDNALEEASSRFEKDGETLFLHEMRMNRERLEGNRGEFRRLAERALEIWPQSPLGIYYLGWAALLEGDRGTAEKYAVLADEMQPMSLQFGSARQVFKSYPDSAAMAFHENGGSMSLYLPDGIGKAPVYGGGYVISPSLMLPSQFLEVAGE